VRTRRHRTPHVRNAPPFLGRRKRKKNETDAEYSARRRRRAHRRRRLGQLAGLYSNPKKARGFWQVHIGGAFSRTFTHKRAGQAYAKRTGGVLSWFTPYSQRNPYRVSVGGSSGARALFPSRVYKSKASARRRVRSIHSKRHLGVSTIWTTRNPRSRVRRRSAFHNPSEKATMAQAMRAAWRAIKRR
jgi:hypothetical protein